MFTELLAFASIISASLTEVRGDSLVMTQTTNWQKVDALVVNLKCVSDIKSLEDVVEPGGSYTIIYKEKDKTGDIINGKVRNSQGRYVGNMLVEQGKANLVKDCY